MSFDDLSKTFESVLNQFMEWFDLCRHPLTSVDALISLHNERDKISKSLRLWCVSFLLTLILNLPLLKIVGIEWETVGFHLPNFLLLTFLLMLSGLILHLGMRIYGIPSNVGDTVGAYTIVVCCYSPLLALLNYPAMDGLLASLRTAKGQHLSFIAATVFTMAEGRARNASYLGVVSTAMQYLGGIVSCLLLTLIARKLSEAYCVPRSRMLAAFGFSVGALFVPMAVAFAAAYYFVIYAFTSGGGKNGM
jgi:hypothetical protein